MLQLLTMRTWVRLEIIFSTCLQVLSYISEVLEKASVSAEDIDMFLLHQANVRIISSVAKRLGVSPEKLPVNLHNYGNTSAASIPILFDELKKNGSLDDVHKIVLSGFGGGLTWGASYMEM